MSAEFDVECLDWNKGEGLLPTIVQDARDGRVLMLAYMTREALERTQKTGRVTFYSRSRRCLWAKGETSGHYLNLVSIHADCDADALLVLAEPQGPVCHTGAPTCFDGVSSPSGFIVQLDALIAEREHERPPDSYTAELFVAGIPRIARKVGEEAIETALAAVGESDKAFLGEAADLMYHLLVLLQARALSLEDLEATLYARHGDKERRGC